MTAPQLETRRIETNDAAISETSALLRHVWPHEHKFHSNYLTWLYRDNVLGPVVGFNAYAGALLAAHYATVPVEADYFGRKAKGLLSLNTATHPDHQGKGLFTLLAKATYEAAAQEGFSFVVGVANANSTPGFVKKLSFQLVTPLDVRVGVGPLPEEAPGPVSFRRLWTPESLRWRLAARASRYCARPDGKGLVVESPTSYPWIRAPLARLQDPQLVEVAARLPRALPSPRVWFGCAGTIKWPIGYTTLPERFKLSPLNLILRRLDGGTEPLQPEATRFQALDFDAY